MDRGEETQVITEMGGTKWELFKTAINMFAREGFANVSVRDIAGVMEMNPASLYNHFPNKDAFLAEAYKFYTDNYYARLPALPSLIAMVGEIPPKEIWTKIPPIYEGELLDLMTEIVLIAVEERRRDKGACELISKVFIEMPKRYLGAIIDEMMRQGIIEPVDKDGFANVFSAFNLYASVRIGGHYQMSTKEWWRGHEFIFDIIKLKKSNI